YKISSPGVAIGLLGRKNRVRISSGDLADIKYRFGFLRQQRYFRKADLIPLQNIGKEFVPADGRLGDMKRIQGQPIFPWGNDYLRFFNRLDRSFIGIGTEGGEQDKTAAKQDCE